MGIEDASEYEGFKREIVDVGVQICGEDSREYWEGCDFEDYFTDGSSPEEVVSDDMSYWEPD